MPRLDSTLFATSRSPCDGTTVGWWTVLPTRESCACLRRGKRGDRGGGWGTGAAEPGRSPGAPARPPILILLATDYGALRGAANGALKWDSRRDIFHPVAYELRMRGGGRVIGPGRKREARPPPARRRRAAREITGPWFLQCCPPGEEGEGPARRAGGGGIKIQLSSEPPPMPRGGQPGREPGLSRTPARQATLSAPRPAAEGAVGHGGGPHATPRPSARPSLQGGLCGWVAGGA